MKKIQKYISCILLYIGIILTVGCSKKMETIAIPINNRVETNIVTANIEIPEVEEEEEIPIEDPIEVPTEEPEEKPIEVPVEKPKENDTNTGMVTNGKPYYVKVNRLANCVTIYKQDANGNYTVPVKSMICSVGKNIDKTPKGVFSTSDKYTWRYLFGDQYGQYATRITGHILFHSVPYSIQSKDTLKTNYYNNLGVGDSMGCIRLTCADAKWIYDNCPKGTKVEIYDSTDPGPLGKPSAMKIDVNSPYAGWDPTDPDGANPWKTAKPTILGVVNITSEQGVEVDYSSYVSARDAFGINVTVTTSGSVDSYTCGEYVITYSATDSRGNVATETAVITVVESVGNDEQEQ